MSSENIQRDGDPFYYPPEVDSDFDGDISTGEILLFPNDNWNDDPLVIDTLSPVYPPGYPFSFSGTDVQDKTTWIVFKLEKGVVCTLFNNVPDLDDNPYDFSGAGNCVDLIGNGEIQTVDLNKYDANDRLSAGVWRAVDAPQGWFQLFKDYDQKGVFSTFFLDEWAIDTNHVLDKWWLQDNVTSINYPCLTPVQRLILTTTSEGGGQSKTLGPSNRFNHFENKATFHLSDAGINDDISCFSYTIISPVRAKIENVSITADASISGDDSFQQSFTCMNDASTEVKFTATVATGRSMSIDHTISQGFNTNTSISASIEATAEIPEVASMTVSMAGSFSVDHSVGAEKTTSNSIEQSLEQSVDLTVPPKTNYKATCRIAVGEVPTTRMEVTGRFYYKQYVPGANLTYGPDGTALHELAIPIVVNLEGSVGSTVQVFVDSTPIEG